MPIGGGEKPPGRRAVNIERAANPIIDIDAIEQAVHVRANVLGQVSILANIIDEFLMLGKAVSEALEHGRGGRRKGRGGRCLSARRVGL